MWDTGYGIAPEHLEDIFKEFHQLGNPERDRRKGLGLGLAIVRRLAQEMRTQVEVRSRPGRGSMFRLCLPAWHGALEDETSALSDEPGLTGLRVLVIDDDEAVRLGMLSLLESWGCICRCAESSADALLRLRGWPTPDVIVTDFRLRHEETGKQALQALRSHLRQSVPAIIMTGDTSPQRLRMRNRRRRCCCTSPCPPASCVRHCNRHGAMCNQNHSCLSLIFNKSNISNA